MDVLPRVYTGMDMYIFYWDVCGIINNLDIYRMFVLHNTGFVVYAYICTYGSIYNTLLNSYIIRSYSRYIYVHVKCMVKPITTYGNLPTPSQYSKLFITYMFYQFVQLHRHVKLSIGIF